MAEVGEQRGGDGKKVSLCAPQLLSSLEVFFFFVPHSSLLLPCSSFSFPFPCVGGPAINHVSEGDIHFFLVPGSHNSPNRLDSHLLL